MDGKKAAFSNFSGAVWKLPNQSSLFFFNPGGLEMEGVYRVNGGQLTMKKLRTSFDQGKLSCCVCLFITTSSWHQIQRGGRRTSRI